MLFSLVWYAYTVSYLQEYLNRSLTGYVTFVYIYMFEQIT